MTSGERLSTVPQNGTRRSFILTNPPIKQMSQRSELVLMESRPNAWRLRPEVKGRTEKAVSDSSLPFSGCVRAGHYKIEWVKGMVCRVRLSGPYVV
jgi:hypothetical protein